VGASREHRSFRLRHVRHAGPSSIAGVLNDCVGPSDIWEIDIGHARLSGPSQNGRRVNVAEDGDGQVEKTQIARSTSSSVPPPLSGEDGRGG
jgi:hypothetical protein